MSFVDRFAERASVIGRAVFGDITEVSGAAVTRELKQWFDQTTEHHKIARGNPRALAPFAMKGSHGALSDILRIEQDLTKRLLDYDDMDCYTPISAALDIYADDATIQSSSTGRAIWTVSNDVAIKEILDHWLYNIIRVDEELWERARTLAKYGNNCEELLIKEDVGVLGMTWLPIHSMRRVETEKGSLVGYIQSASGRFQGLTQSLASMISSGQKIDQKSLPDGMVFFEPWEISHSRLRGKDMQSPYGHSVAENVRWVFRRLLMLQDALLIHKLTKSPARFAYFVEVGDMAPDDATSYLAAVRTEFRNSRKAKQSNQPYAVEYQPNPLASDEDLWIPTRGGTGTSRVEVLSGADYQAIEDVELFERMMHAGLKVPRSYMAYEGDTNRATLSQQDVQFARSVLRLSKALRSGLKHAARIHLAVQGIDPDKYDWTFESTMPSSVFELAQIEVDVARADLASRQDQFFPKEWTLENTFRMSTSESIALSKSKREELLALAKEQADLQMSMMAGQTQTQVDAQMQLMSADAGSDDGGGGGRGGPPIRQGARPALPSKFTGQRESESPQKARERRTLVERTLGDVERTLKAGKASPNLRRDVAVKIRRLIS